MNGQTILVCEDNIIVQDILREYLLKEGYNLLNAMDGESALEIIKQQAIDLIVLDIMLPGISGFDVCKEVRKSSRIPIIILSARGTAPDRVTGLELGADDYVTKPFSPREVLIRIKKLLERNSAAGQQHKISVAELEVFPDANMVCINDKKIEMTNKETLVLEYLIKNTGKVVSREQIMENAWDKEHTDDERVVDTLIKRIRRKTNVEGVHFKISSVYGKGYKIEEI